MKTNMNIGSLYLVKKWFWLLFPSKETTTTAAATAHVPAAADEGDDCDDDIAADVAAYWSRYCNCEVTYFSPDSYVVFLEENGRYKKVLTSDGRIGWTWFIESYNNRFEEVKSE